MTYLKKLNDNQKEAVVSNDKYIRVVAGAGSGKTRVLTSRIVHLINSGIKPHKILAITFTNKAANEMKTRVNDGIEPVKSKPFISTFHAFCVRLLKEEHDLVNFKKDFNIIDDQDQQKLLKEILKENNIPKEELDEKIMSNYISNRKTYFYEKTYKKEDFSIENLEEKKAAIYNTYNSRLRKMNSFDFDDLLLNAYKVLKKDSEVLKKWQNRYEHILVDEFQDTNDIQFELVKQLVGKNNNLFVVGDPDQTIYSWRGANIRIIKELEKTFPSTKTVVLNQNYRSNKNILDVSNRLIKNNKNRIHKDLVSDKVGNQVVYKNFSSQAEEAFDVLMTIKNHIAKGEINLKDIAILYRANYQSREIEKILTRANINFRIFGGVGFYSRKEIKDALAYLKVVANKDDDLSLIRIINEPKRGLGDTTLNKFIALSNQYNKSLFDTIKENSDIVGRTKSKKEIENLINTIDEYSQLVDKASHSELLNNLLTSTGYYQSLYSQEEYDRIENIKELVNELVNYENSQDDTGLVNFLQEATLYSSQDEIKDGNYVSLMTVHTAKGLEYPCVFLYGFNEGVFPSYRSIMESKGGLEEERRLAYVAFTRAKDYLYISSNSDFNFITQSRNKPSRFVDEIMQKNLYKKEDNATISRKPRPVSYAKQTTTNKISWKNGDTIVHENFGLGVVIDVDNNLIKVAFKDSKLGVKTLIGNHGKLTRG